MVEESCRKQRGDETKDVHELLPITRETRLRMRAREEESGRGQRHTLKVRTGDDARHDAVSQRA
jgi:hypothetical protein